MSNAFSGMRISASGLAAERLRMDLIASNIANANTTRGADGKPYRRKVAVFNEYIKEEIGKNGEVKEEMMGVRAAEIVEDDSPLRSVYDPSHPDADEDGYVLMPNVNHLNEMADLMMASRAFEANLTCIEAQKQMITKSLEIGR
ncbi:flagellar basal body rod protein FlgC [Oceanirhabdus sp. W0125-5]|uniref:flagellar basal body rod protein FlgC n=1 Tax=Oceanirhabdus sp. W0125-5 TaxID=2999116 RepID=UPI0022F3375F|nr:flagellar basal body rod protein FlgC [Oceanirhabdus sp. W0125-5]WBW95434.1 flagellar basal body rod protein FlgC [Oceanirhabdus sp. W0125-5]